MRVRAIRDCFVGALRKAGEEFEYTGPKNTNLEPMRTSAKKATTEPEEDEKGIKGLRD